MQSRLETPAVYLSVANGLIIVEGRFADDHSRPAKKVVVRLGDRRVPCRAGKTPHHFSTAFRSRRGLKYLVVEAETEDGRIVKIGRRIVLFSTRGQAETTYRLWLAENLLDNPPPAAPSHGPRFTTILATPSPRPDELRRSVESLLKQTYTRWELLVLLDPAMIERARTSLASLFPNEPRIRLEPARALVEPDALDGDFILRIEQGDQLAPHAFSEIALSALAHPAARLIYSDEDKIDGLGGRSAPCFKPAWNPELLLSHNYLGRLACHHTAVIRELGGFPADAGPATEWDLGLRATATLPDDAILHVPRILCHTRKLASPTPCPSGSENAEKLVLDAHLSRSGIDASTTTAGDGLWRVQRRLPANSPRVSLIIPTRNGVALLRVCVESILKHTSYPNHEILVVDNGSDDPETLDYLDELKTRGVKILRDDGPFNYSAINNRAVAHATGSVLGFLNNDIEAIDSGWLEEMASRVLEPQVGAVGAMLYFPDDRIQHAGVVLGIAGPRLVEGIAGHAFKFASRYSAQPPVRRRVAQNYSAVTAACLLVRREAFERIGGFDEQNLAVAYNDVDFCLRLLAAGYRNVWTPFAEFYHHESATRGTDTTPAKKTRYESEVAYMRKTWGALLDNDPAYNPNLTLLFEDFSPAFPVRRQTNPRTAAPLVHP